LKGNLGKKVTFGIVGTGILGTVIAVLLERSGHYTCAGVHTHSCASYERFCGYLEREHLDLNNLAERCEVLFITTYDDSIRRVAEQLDVAEQPAPLRHKRLLVHCSGSLPSSVMDTRTGQNLYVSIHPYRSFATIADGLTQMPGTPFGVEGTTPQAMREGEKLVDALGGIAYPISTEAKTLYHAAAVFASNYLVTLTAIGVRLFEQIGLNSQQSLELLLPLMEGTTDNIRRHGLPDALTGPIARGDVNVIRKHLTELPAELHRLYCVLGEQTLEIGRQKKQRVGEAYSADVEEELRSLFTRDGIYDTRQGKA